MRSLLPLFAFATVLLGCPERTNPRPDLRIHAAPQPAEMNEPLAMATPHVQGRPGARPVRPVAPRAPARGVPAGGVLR